MRGRLNSWLLILVGICAVSLWFGKDLVRRDSDADAEPRPGPAKLVDFSLAEEEKSIHLVVLNGTSEPGLAREIGLWLGRAGCVTESVGNAPEGDFEHSLLVNRRLSDRRALELARRLGGVRIIREWDDRGAEDAVLVLGRDHEQVKSSLAKAATGGGS